jgi:hypothetical protein
MGTTTSTALTATYPVQPGTTVTREVYTDTGFSAGDYVYNYGSGSIGSAPNAGSYALFNITFPIGGYGFGTYFQAFPTGLTFSKANFIGPQTGPTTYTYSGTSSTFGGTQLAATTIQATASQQGPASATLTNGNIVTIFNNSTGGTLYFQITTPAGSAVANGTIATNVLTSDYTTYYGKNYAVCALNAGGFAVVWTNTSSYLSSASYSATGTNIVAASQIYSAGNAYLPWIIVNSSDTPVISWTNSTSGGGTGTVAYFGNGIGSALTASYPPTSGSFSPDSAIRMVITGNQLSWVFTDKSTNSTNIFGYSSNYLSSFSQTSYTTFSNASTSYGSEIFITPTYSGYLAVAWQYGAILYLACYPQNSAAISSIGAITTYNTPGCSFGVVPYLGNATTYSGTQDATLVYYRNGSGTFMNTAVVTYPSASATPVVSSITTTAIDANHPGPRYSYVNLFGNYNGVLYPAVTTTYPTLIEINNFPLTNGTAYNVPATYSSLTPPYGYTFIGVAATTASAGSFGSVVVNGTTQLNSSYGTSSTPKAFNYNPLNRPNSIWNGNRGFVVNRTVTLQGLE